MASSLFGETFHSGLKCIFFSLLSSFLPVFYDRFQRQLHHPKKVESGYMQTRVNLFRPEIFPLSVPVFLWFPNSLHALHNETHSFFKDLLLCAMTD